MQRPSGPASKGARSADVATVPPPKGKRAKPADTKATETKNSGIRSRKPPPPAPAKKDGKAPGAKVDEVTADLSKDPRRDDD
ncbi:MAG TPA: hypothetical protein VGL81_01575 [Polyangiaceae bacterium]